MLFFDFSPSYMKSAILLPKDSKERISFENSLKDIKDYKYFKPSLSLEINDNQIYFFKINLSKFEDFKKSLEFIAIVNFLENLRNHTNAEYWSSDPNDVLNSKSFMSIGLCSGIIQSQEKSEFLITKNPAEIMKNLNEQKTDQENIIKNIAKTNNQNDNFNNNNLNDSENKNKEIIINLPNKNVNEKLISNTESLDAKDLNKINAYYCGILKNELEKYIEDLFFCKLIKTGHTNQLTIIGLDYIFNTIKKSFFYLPGQKISNLVKVGKLDEVTEKNYTTINEQFYPFIMANILEGTSVYKVESRDKFHRIGGSNFGASSYWSLVSMICGYDDPEKAVEDAIKGNNELIDLSVSDIYGGGYDTFNLDSSLIASSFGKIKYINDISEIDKKDISRSLMTLMCVTASQICAFLAKQENIKNIIIVGNSFESLEFMQMVQMCVGYYSQDKCKAYFSQYSPFINLIGMIKLIGL